jgi:hypothetical protein
MGVDVTMWVEGPMSEEDAQLGIDRLPTGEFFPYVHVDRHFEQAGRVVVDRIEYVTGDRYYGIGYERGPWPQIRESIIALRDAFPDRTVFYGSDTTEWGSPVDDEYLAEIDAHAAGPNGRPYWDQRG